MGQPAAVNPGQVITCKVSATISAYKVVGGYTGANSCRIQDTNTMNILGVTINDSQGGSDSSIAVALSGVVKCICAASVSAGSIVTYDPTIGSGNIIAAANIINSSTSAVVPKVVGLALQAGSTNSVIAVALQIQNTFKPAY